MKRIMFFLCLTTVSILKPSLTTHTAAENVIISVECGPDRVIKTSPEVIGLLRAINYVTDISRFKKTTTYVYAFPKYPSSLVSFFFERMGPLYLQDHDGQIFPKCFTRLTIKELKQLVQFLVHYDAPNRLIHFMYMLITIRLSTGQIFIPHPWVWQQFYAYHPNQSSTILKKQ